MKIRRVGFALFPVNRRTDRHDKVNDCHFPKLLLRSRRRISWRRTVHSNASEICVLLQVYWLCVETPDKRDTHVQCVMGRGYRPGWSGTLSRRPCVVAVAERYDPACTGRLRWTATCCHQLHHHVTLRLTNLLRNPRAPLRPLMAVPPQYILFHHRLLPTLLCSLERLRKRSCPSVRLSIRMFQVDNRWV